MANAKGEVDNLHIGRVDGVGYLALSGIGTVYIGIHGRAVAGDNSDIVIESVGSVTVLPMHDMGDVYVTLPLGVRASLWGGGKKCR